MACGKMRLEFSSEYDEIKIVESLLTEDILLFAFNLDRNAVLPDYLRGNERLHQHRLKMTSSSLLAVLLEKRCIPHFHIKNINFQVGIANLY